MSSPATDTVRLVNEGSKDEDKVTAPVEEAKPLDSQKTEEPETAGDAEPVDASKSATVSASNAEHSEQTTVPSETKNTKEESTEPKEDQQPNNHVDKPKPVAASTHSKTSSFSKSLSNGKLFGKKSNGDASKRGTAVTRKEASNLSSASETLVKKDKKRGKIWRFLHSCFTPSDSHAIHDEDSISAPDAKKKRASANTNEPSEKKKADLAVDTAAANLSLTASAPSPPTPSKSHSATAAAGGDVIVPGTPKHELLPLEDTEGVTSGAVQAPGSTGIEADDSEASVTDDERHRPLDDEDDEERLIMNGGNGIPIGPVCKSFCSLFSTLAEPA